MKPSPTKKAERSKMSPQGGGCEKPRSLEESAGLYFPPHKFGKLLVASGGSSTQNASWKSLFRLTAAIQYITAEVLELAGNEAKDDMRDRIRGRHIWRAIQKDESLKKLLGELFLPAAMEQNVELLSKQLGGLTVDHDNNDGGV